MARSSGVFAAALALLIAATAAGPLACAAWLSAVPTAFDTAAAAGAAISGSTASAATPAKCFTSFIVVPS